MTEMIKKHTVERSANWETICSLIDQTKEILRKTKTQSLIFVCVNGQFDFKKKVRMLIAT